MIQYNEYYPYGLQTRNSWTRDGSKNNFLHNGGTELNSSSGYYDLFYRNYDAAIAKFIQVDPLAQMDHSVSPYAYAGNNPLMFNDPLGDVKITQETPMYNPNAGWGSFALNYAAFRSSTFIGGFSYFAYVDPAFAFLQISPEAHATLYGTATTDEIYGKRWNPHGGEQITYEEWRALSGNDPRATDKDLFFSGGWEVQQGSVDDPKWGNLVDPSSFTFDYAFGRYATYVNYKETMSLYMDDFVIYEEINLDLKKVALSIRVPNEYYENSNMANKLAGIFDLARFKLFDEFRSRTIFNMMTDVEATSLFMPYVNDFMQKALPSPTTFFRQNVVLYGDIPRSNVSFYNPFVSPN